MKRHLLGFLAAAVLSGIAFCSGAFAQVTSFPSSATVSYNLAGQLIGIGESGVPFGDDEQASTSNPFANPVQLNGSINGGSAGPTATATATATASAGLLRAGVDGTAAATWPAGGANESRLNASSLVTWTDYCLVLGNPAQPQPFRPLVVQALLNVGGLLSVTPTPDPSFPGFSAAFGDVKLRLTGRDEANRNLLAPPPFLYAGDYGHETAGSGDYRGITIHQTPIPVIAVTLNLLEGQPAFMSFSMEVVAAANAKNSPYFAAGSTSVTFNGDFTHTLSWGGITSVTDANTGQAVPGWSVESASGANYANAIPEPAGLMFFALAAGGLRRRRWCFAPPGYGCATGSRGCKHLRR